MRPYLLQHSLELSAENYPKKQALKHNDDFITYEELCPKAAALGYELKNFGILKGERIGILLDKSINQVISLLGILYADMIFVIINPMLRIRQIQHILSDCSIKCVITSKKHLSKIELVIKENNVKNLLLEESFNEIFSSNEGKRPNCLNISDDISNIIYTSGSTGLPKGIVITHRNLIDGASIVSKYLNITEDERILGLLPFNFDYGLNQLTSTLMKGCTIVLFQFFMPNAFLKVLLEENITGLAAIPPIWASVFNSKLCKIDGRNQFSSLRYITNSGGKLPVATVRKIRNTFKGTKLFLMYGLTEAFRSTYLDPAEVDKRPDSIGKAIPNVQVEIINEIGKSCKPEEVGELIHRGACIAKGYWNNPELTTNVYRPNPLFPDGNQFLETVVYSGDLAKKDSEGFIYFLGRKDAMIKADGYRVSPTEVEELLMNYDGINEAVAFGMEIENLGTKIIAIITGNGEIEIDEVIAYCRREAPAYLVPHEIILRDSLQKTDTGKIDRKFAINEVIEKHVN